MRRAVLAESFSIIAKFEHRPAASRKSTLMGALPIELARDPEKALPMRS